MNVPTNVTVGIMPIDKSSKMYNYPLKCIWALRLPRGWKASLVLNTFLNWFETDKFISLLFQLRILENLEYDFNLLVLTHSS